MSGPRHPSDHQSSKLPPEISLTHIFGNQMMTGEDKTEPDVTRSKIDDEMEDEDNEQEMLHLWGPERNENHHDTIYTTRESMDDALHSPLRRAPRMNFGRSSLHQSNGGYGRNVLDVLDIVQRHLDPDNASMAYVPSTSASRPARRRRRSESSENMEEVSHGRRSQAVQTLNLPYLHHHQQTVSLIPGTANASYVPVLPDTSNAFDPPNYVNSNSNNSRLPSQRPASASSSSARGVRRDSFSRTVNSENLFADEASQSQDRKRRRREQEGDGHGADSADSSLDRVRRLPHGKLISKFTWVM